MSTTLLLCTQNTMIQMYKNQETIRGILSRKHNIWDTQGYQWKIVNFLKITDSRD